MPFFMLAFSAAWWYNKGKLAGGLQCEYTETEKTVSFGYGRHNLSG